MALTVDRADRRRTLIWSLGASAAVLLLLKPGPQPRRRRPRPDVVGAVYADGALGTVFVTLAVVALAGSLMAAAGAEEASGQRPEDVAP